MTIVSNLHKLRQMMSDPKVNNVSKYLDDDVYCALLREQGVEPFYTFDPTDTSTLRLMKLARIEGFLTIAGDDELSRRIQEEMQEQGDWDIYKHIRYLKLELSRLNNSVFGV